MEVHCDNLQLVEVRIDTFSAHQEPGQRSSTGDGTGRRPVSVACANSCQTRILHHVHAK